MQSANDTYKLLRLVRNIRTGNVVGLQLAARLAELRREREHTGTAEPSVPDSPASKGSSEFSS